MAQSSGCHGPMIRGRMIGVAVDDAAAEDEADRLAREPGRDQ